MLKLLDKFMEETSDALRRHKATESAIFLGAFNANVGNDAMLRKLWFADTVMLT